MFFHNAIQMLDFELIIFYTVSKRNLYPGEGAMRKLKQKLIVFFQKVIELFAKWEANFDKACVELKKEGFDVEARLNSSSLDR